MRGEEGRARSDGEEEWRGDEEGRRRVADILRSTAVFPSFHAALSVDLVEVSTHLISAAADDRRGRRGGGRDT